MLDPDKEVMRVVEKDTITVDPVMFCPECQALHGQEIQMRELICGRKYSVTRDGLTPTKNVLRLFQCPSCKSVYTEKVDEVNDAWTAQFQELMKGVESNG